MASNADVYDSVTQKMIQALEAGVVPWRKPWNGGSAIRNPRCEVCDLFMDDPYGADHELCLEALCGVCDHTNGAHWTTNDGRWSGCADCLDCEGYAPQQEG